MSHSRCYAKIELDIEIGLSNLTQDDIVELAKNEEFIINEVKEELEELPFEIIGNNVEVLFVHGEGLCKYCGSELVEHREKHPYGDTTATEILAVCPNCEI